MFKKKLIIGLLLIISILSISCSSTNETKKENKDEIKVGLSISTLNNPFFVSVKDGVLDKAKDENIKVKVADAQNDTAKQANDIDDLLQSNIDILIINPVDSSAISTSVLDANEKKIPVITLDRSSDDGEVIAFIASDNKEGGKLAAQYIVDKLGENAKVIELQGILGSSAARERGEGFESIADEKLEIVAKQSANFDRAEGLSVTENLLQSNSDVLGIFAQNDEMALGALEAVKAINKDILIVGFDGTDDAKNSIKEGNLNATIAQQPKLMGEKAIETVKKYLNNEEIKKYIPVELKLIDKDNIE